MREIYCMILVESAGALLKRRDQAVSVDTFGASFLLLITSIFCSTGPFTLSILKRVGIDSSLAT